MAITYFPEVRSIANMNPVKVSNLAKPNGFSHVVRSGSNPGLFYISGQSPTDERGNTVGVGDFEAQVVQTFENVKKCLQAIGATFEDVTKLTFLVVPMDKFDIVRKVRKRYLNQRKLPAITSVGVTSLVNKEWLIELEAIVETGSKSR